MRTALYLVVGQAHQTGRVHAAAEVGHSATGGRHVLGLDERGNLCEEVGEREIETQGVGMGEGRRVK